MLSINAIGGDGSYYLDLAEEDYYLEGGEPEGIWLGSGVGRYDLIGQKVDEQSLKSLLLGFHPDSPKKAVLNAGKENRQQGYDFCFSAPKSVSLAFAGGDHEIRNRIQKAHQNAVSEAIGFLEKQAAMTRRGNKGVKLERAKLMVAAFEHSTSRALDPNLHTHCLIMNVCERFDGTTGTLYGHVKRDSDGRIIETFNPLYRHKMAAGAVYRMELAHQLTKTLGCRLRVGEKYFSFEVDGFTVDVIREFSKRSEEIGRLLKEQGFESPEAAENAALSSRLKKQDVLRPELFKKWKAELREVGYAEETIKALFPRRYSIGQNELLSSKKEFFEQAVKLCYQELAESGKQVEIKDLYQKTAIELQTTGISFQELDAEIQKQLVSGQIVSIGVDRLSHQISSERMIRLENQALKMLEKSRENNSHGIVSHLIEKEFEKNRQSLEFDLSFEQKDAIKYLTEVQLKDTCGAIRVLTGDAGSGKTTVLKTAAKVWESGGYRVVGASLSNQAAQELETAAKISSYSIAKWEYELEKTASQKIIHHAKMLGIAARGGYTYPPENQFYLDKNTVLVVDEVAMADTPSLQKLVDEAVNKGAKICLVGDDKQCASITHGGFFSAAVAKIENFRLTENWRQKFVLDQAIVKLFSQRKTDLALRRMAIRGQIVVKDSEQSALTSLVKAWSEKGLKDPKENLIIVATHKQRQDANLLCQKTRLGKLQRLLPISLKNHEGQRLYINDRIQFAENLFAYNLKTKKYEKIVNRSFGKVTGINLKTEKLTIHLDDGRKLLVGSMVKRKQEKLFHPIRRTKARIALGYATTTHGVQGSTVDRSYVMAGGFMQDAELTYVQMSRARLGTKLFTSREQAGPELTWLASNRRAKNPTDLLLEADKKFQRNHRVESSMLCKGMNRSRKKNFALLQETALEEQRVTKREKKINQGQQIS